MAQVSYGTITITDTTDIERIYMVYAGSESNTTSPDADNFTLWKTDITQISGTYIWQRAVVKKSGIEITVQNFQQFYGEPVCITGEGGRSIKSITTYYCNYGTGTPDENYNGWSINTPEYDEDKPNYWIKTVIIYVDDSEEEFSLSGSIVSIEDGGHKQATSLSVDLQPIQSLNGYDKPWSGGNGVNKMPYPNEREVTFSGVTFKSDGKGNVTINGTCTGSDYAAISVPEFTIPDGTDYKVAFLNTQALSGMAFLYGSTIVDSWSLNTVNKESTYSAMSNKQCNGIRLNIVEGQTYNQKMSIMFVPKDTTVTSYIPYENICPISGRTECDTYVVGKNLCKVSADNLENKQNSTVTYTDTGITVTASGRYARASYRIAPLEVGETYTVSLKGQSNGGLDSVYINHNTPWGGGSDRYATIQLTSTEQYKTATFTASEETLYLGFYVSSSQTTGEMVISDLQLEKGTTATPYEPYNGQTYTTTLGRTVYGGTLDVTTGVLTVDMKYDQMTYAWLSTRPSADIGYTANVSAVGGNSVWVRNWNYIDYPAIVSGGIKAVCNAFQVSMHNRDLASSQYRIYFGIGSMTSIDEFLSAVQALETSGSGLWIAHELATPQTYQLTETQINLLSGQNNVWSDGEIRISGFTIVDKDVQIHLDNGLTNALAKSADAQSKATDALTKANNATQAVALMGGHFIYKSSNSGNSTPAGAGVIRNLDDNPANWGYNTWIGSDGIALRHGENILSQWMTTGISFYNTNHIVTSTFGDSIALASNGATVTIGSTGTGKYNTYINSQGIFLRENTTAYATLDNNGLTLSKGGIRVNPVGSNNGVYISSDNLGSTVSIGGSKTDWRAVIGSKFAVDSQGNLYASNVNISGSITATSLTITNDAEVSGVVVPEDISDMATTTDVSNALYSVEIKATAIDYVANTATLTAIPFYQGSTNIPNNVTLVYTWYKDSVISSNIVGSNSNTLTITNTTAMGLNRIYFCVISTN